MTPSHVYYHYTTARTRRYLSIFLSFFLMISGNSNDLIVLSLYMKERFENSAQSEDVEVKFENLTNIQKFEKVLKLFGSASARNNFLEACRKYAALRMKAQLDTHGEDYQPITRKTYSPPRRANLHNQIMETLKNLSLQRLDPLSERILREMASRETAGQIIKDWVLAEETNQEEDEAEQERKRDDMSGPAYFHSLGREH